MTMRLLVLLLLPPLSQAAPKAGTTRLVPEVQQRPLPNPFQPGPEQLRLLRNYLKGLERMEEDPEHMSREQVLLYLFALHDYDHSGQLDGLELMSMLTAALAPAATDSPATNPVVAVVDQVLATQDLNGDGLMTPAELINFPGEAPRPAEPREPREPREPQDLGRRPPTAESPSRQEAQGATGPREDEGWVEAGEEARGKAPGPGGEAGAQAEAGDDGKRAEELPGETLEPKNPPGEFEVHAIQLENEEM